MKNPRRLRLVGIAFILTVAAAILIHFMVTTPHTDRSAAPAEAPVTRGVELGPPSEPVRLGEASRQGALLAPAHRKNLDSQILKLRGESPRESIRLLHQPRLYFFPGVRRGTVTFSSPGFPLDSVYETWVIETIFSNRRFLKVAHELSSNSRGQAAPMILQQMNESLPLYAKTMRAFVAGLLEENKDFPAKPAVSPSVLESDPKGGFPTLEGLRYQVLGLGVIAGSLDLVEARPAIDSLIDEAIAQRKLLYASKLPPGIPFSLLKSSGIYNRQALATAWLGTRPSPVEARARASGMGVKFRTVKLTRFDANATEHDAAWAIFAKPDFSKGSLNITLVDSIDESPFNKLLGIPDEPVTALSARPASRPAK